MTLNYVLYTYIYMYINVPKMRQEKNALQFVSAFEFPYYV